MSFSDWFVLLRMSSKLIYVVLCCRIPLRLNNLPLYVSTRFSLSIHPRMETLVISIYLILHMVLQLTWKNQHLFEILIPITWDKFRSEITGTYSSPIFYFWRNLSSVQDNCHTVVHSGYTLKSSAIFIQ